MATTQRQRAANDPFWATALTRMTPAGQRLARGLHALIKRSPALAALLWIGSGWRSSSSEHVTGRALDVIATAKPGILARAKDKAGYAAMNQLINDVLIPHAAAPGIRHIIWDRRSYRTRYKAWWPLPGRTSSSGVSDWHEDHAHIWLKPSAVGWLDKLDKVIVTDKGTSATSAPKPTTPAKPKTVRYKVATRLLPLNGRTGPGTKYRKVTSAKKGTVLTIVATKSGWAKDTKDRWWKLSYLKKA